MSQSFTDPNKWLEEFAHSFDVVCPNCNSHSKVYRSTTTPHTARFVCSSCGKSRKWKGSSSIVTYSAIPPQDAIVCYGGAFDAFFHYPLFLKTSSCGNDLWAFNREHLEFLIGYVKAKQRKPPPEYGSNRTLASRLPHWIMSKKNRKRVTKDLLNLEKKLAESGKDECLACSPHIITHTAP